MSSFWGWLLGEGEGQKPEISEIPKIPNIVLDKPDNSVLVEGWLKFVPCPKENEAFEYREVHEINFDNPLKSSPSRRNRPNGAAFNTVQEMYLELLSKNGGIYFCILESSKALLVYLNKNLKTGPLLKVSLENFTLSLLPQTYKIPTMYDRRYPICMKSSSYEDLPLYIYCLTSNEKEDWYIGFSKIQSSDTKIVKESKLYAENIKRMHTYLSPPTILESLSSSFSIHESNADHPDQATAWFNALFGRLFSMTWNSALVQGLIEENLKASLASLEMPSSVAPLILRSFEITTECPRFSNTKLVSFSEDGVVRINSNISYTGPFKTIVETSVSFDAGLKRLNVPLIMELVISDLTCFGCLMIKKWPSNRIWYTCYTPPNYKISMGTKMWGNELSFTGITQILEQKFREAIQDSMVFPYWGYCLVPGVYSKTFLDEVLQVKSQSTNSLFNQVSSTREAPIETVSSDPESSFLLKRKQKLMEIIENLQDMLDSEPAPDVIQTQNNELRNGLTEEDRAKILSLLN